MIATPDGNRRIEDLIAGDLVLSRDDNGSISSALITDTHLSETWTYLEINGDLRVTESHPFYNKNGEWIEAGQLGIGDKLVNNDGDLIIVSSIQPIHKGVRVYNISVDKNETFFAAGYYVHNKGPVIRY
ncbi:MAG: HINT domain-containing protein [Actinobacteria bacterium]|nr:HINT domain-containing protein [Actinomycetota bacterium]